MNRDLKEAEKNLKTFTVIATDDAVRNGHAPAEFEIKAYSLSEAIQKVAVVAKTVGEKI